MKNIGCWLIIFIFLMMGLPAFVEEDFSNLDVQPAMSVLCIKNKNICTVGRYTLRNSGAASPLYTEDGIVCTTDKKTCTNGYSMINSSVAIEIPAKFVLCTKARRVCTVGEKTLKSGGVKPLYVLDGIVCTTNKKTCTNGYSVITSSEPLY